MSIVKEITVPQKHSTAWIVQAWAAFIISVTATTVGVVNLPESGSSSWIKGYLSLGLLFSISSTFTLGKTVRDMHESEKLASRVDEARVEKLLAEHHPLK